MGQGFRNFKNRLLVLLAGRRAFRSSDETCAAARRLLGALSSAGFAGAAAEVEEGLAGLNGLTDGWACFLEHLEKANGSLPADAKELRRELLPIIRAARYAVWGRGR